MADLEQALDEALAAEAPKEQPQQETPQEAPQEAPKPQEEPKPEPAPEPAPQPEPEAKEHTVPLPKFLDLRDEVKELRRFKAEQEAAKAAPNAPDPYDDPKGYDAYHRSEVQKAVTATKFEISDVMARQTHGVETVETAAEWALKRAEADPVFAAQYMREAHPIDWIVRQHKRDALVSQLPSDVSSLDELVEREIAKRGLTATAAGTPAVETQQAPAKPAAPPKSLVNAPSGGGVIDIPVGPLAALEAVFPG